MLAALITANTEIKQSGLGERGRGALRTGEAPSSFMFLANSCELPVDELTKIHVFCAKCP